MRNPLVKESGSRLPSSRHVPGAVTRNDGEVGGVGCCGAITAECFACAQDGWDDDDQPVNPGESCEWYVATGTRFRVASHDCAQLSPGGARLERRESRGQR